MARSGRLANVWALLFILVLTCYPVVRVVGQVHGRRPPDGVASSTAHVVDRQNPGRRTDYHLVRFETTTGRQGTLSTDRTHLPDTFTVWRDPGTGDWVSPQEKSWTRTVLWLVFGTGLGLVLLVAWVRLFHRERSGRPSGLSTLPS